MPRRVSQVSDLRVEQPQMTTFIDVVFQLLIFFMLTVQFSDASIEKLVLPQSTNPDKFRLSDPTLLIINVMKDGTVKIQGKIWYDSKWNRNPDAEKMGFTKIEELFNKRRHMAKYQEPGQPTLVRYFILVRADRSTDFDHVQRMLMMATWYGGVNKVMFATVKEKA
jgi:biopolymer transport protein ExbD